MLIGCTPEQKKKFRNKPPCSLPSFSFSPSLPHSFVLIYFSLIKPPNIKNTINVEKNHRLSVLYLPFPVNGTLTELGSPRGRRRLTDARRGCRTAEEPAAGRAGGRALQGPSGGSRGSSDSSENCLSLLPLLLNVSQGASVLLSKSTEGKQLWFARGFTATRTGLVGGALSSHVAFPPSAGVGCLMAGVLAFNQPYRSGLGVCL